MSHPSPAVSVVICMFTLARSDQLLAAVRSAFQQTLPPHEVVVVVDGTEEIACEVRAALPPRDRLKVLCLGSNQGVAVARTRGVEHAEGELVAFLDDDAEAEAGWLRQLVEPMAESRILGASGRSDPVFDAPRPAWLPDEFMWTVGCSYRGMPTAPAEVRNFFGGCAVVRRDVFLALGGFGGGGGHRGERVGGSEEAEFCLRATQRTGGTFMFLPSAAIRHHVPPARLTMSYYARRCYGEGLVKSAMAARLDRTSLNPERAFALAMPKAVLRTLLTSGERSRAFGIVLGVVSVLMGLGVGRFRGLEADRAG